MSGQERRARVGRHARGRRCRAALLGLSLAAMAVMAPAAWSWDPPPTTRTVTETVVERDSCTCHYMDKPGIIDGRASQGWEFVSESGTWFEDGEPWVVLYFRRVTTTTTEVPVESSTLANEVTEEAVELADDAEVAFKEGGTDPVEVVDATEPEVQGAEGSAEQEDPPSVSAVEQGIEDASSVLDDEGSDELGLTPTGEMEDEVSERLDGEGGASGLVSDSVAASGAAASAAADGAQSAAARDAAVGNLTVQEGAALAAGTDAAAAVSASAALETAAQDATREAEVAADTPTVGDPVQLATGQFVTTETDAELSAELGVALTRSWGAGAAGRLGAGWSLGLDERILLGMRPGAAELAREPEQEAQAQWLQT